MFPLFSTKIHGVVDYALALAMIIFAFSHYENNSVHPWLLIISGLGIFLIAFNTKFEWGYVGKISMPVHLTSDIIGGGFLAACPLFFPAGREWHMAELTTGIIWLATGITTRPYIIPNHKPVLSPDREGNPPE